MSRQQGRRNEPNQATNSPAGATSRLGNAPQNPAAVTAVDVDGVSVWRVQFPAGVLRIADVVEDEDGDLMSSCLCPPSCAHIAAVHAHRGTQPREEKR